MRVWVTDNFLLNEGRFKAQIVCEKMVIEKLWQSKQIFVFMEEKNKSYLETVLQAEKEKFKLEGYNVHFFLPREEDEIIVFEILNEREIKIWPLNKAFLPYKPYRFWLVKFLSPIIFIMQAVDILYREIPVVVESYNYNNFSPDEHEQIFELFLKLEQVMSFMEFVFPKSYKQYLYQKIKGGAL